MKGDLATLLVRLDHAERECELLREQLRARRSVAEALPELPDGWKRGYEYYEARTRWAEVTVYDVDKEGDAVVEIVPHGGSREAVAIPLAVLRALLARAGKVGT